MRRMFLRFYWPFFFGAAMQLVAWSEDSVARQTEKDWGDGRWNTTEIGNFLSTQIKLPSGTVARGLVVKVGGETVAYNLDTVSESGRWDGALVKFDPSRYGLIAAPTPAGPLRAAVAAPRNAKWRGLHVRGDMVILEYNLDGMRCWERPVIGGVEALKILPPLAGPRWTTLKTQGQRAVDTGAYVMDTLTMPYDNP